jgi:hypothetical protein
LYVLLQALHWLLAKHGEKVMMPFVVAALATLAFGDNSRGYG